MPAFPRSNDDREIIARYAGRVRSWAEELARCHDLGVMSGDHREPWSLDFHQQAVEIYFETLPLDYELKLAAAYNACAALMQAEDVPVGLMADWALICTYLESAAKAVQAHSDIAANLDPNPDLAAVEATPPGLVLFGKLAALVHPEGAERLSSAARAVIAHRLAVTSQRPTDVELGWIRALASGERVLDVATREGCTDRTMYRRLHELWEGLGVANAREGLLLATRNGWL